MDIFTIGGAWTRGFGFIMQRLAGIALLLLVMGIAGPIALEYAFFGGAIGSANPTMLGANPLASPYGPTTELLAVTGGAFVLQVGSYFAAWRHGFGGSLPLAILYGIVGAVIALIAFVAAYFIAYYAAQPFLTPETVFLAVLVFLLPFILVIATFLITQAALIAATLILVLSFAMVYGAAVGQLGTAATITGGSGAIAVLLLLLSIFLFWLAARLSCATAWMAERGSLNIFAAMAASWRMTADEQWAVTRYLALIGFIVALVIIGISIASGMGATNALESGGGIYGDPVGALVLRVIMAVPIAFLTVTLPVGIYRELSGTDQVDAAEVFA